MNNGLDILSFFLILNFLTSDILSNSNLVNGIYEYIFLKCLPL